MHSPEWLHTALEIVLIAGYLLGAFIDAFGAKLPQLSFCGQICLLALLCLNFELLYSIFGGFLIFLILLYVVSLTVGYARRAKEADRKLSAKAS